MRRKSKIGSVVQIEQYQAVRSGLDISRSVADYWEQTAPNTTNEQRATSIRAVNDILQGRSTHTAEELFDFMGDDPQAAALRRDILDFLAQRGRLDRPYSSHSVMAYPSRLAYNHVGKRPLKIIDQALYDRAVKEGFPLDFFRESYFDHVTLYCLPERADCNFSYFDRCSFQVCRISGAIFDGTTLEGCAFHTAQIDHVTFCGASIAHTHFHDCDLEWVSFQKAHMKSCNTIDCRFQNVGFLDARLDGCTYGRISAQNIRQLETTTITMGGATAEECAANRKAILRSLCPAPRRRTAQGKKPGGR